MKSYPIANLRIGTPFSGDNAPAVRYYLEDHLGNCSFTLETNGSLFSREDFAARTQAAKKAFETETSFGSFAKKRYRFCGKERDEESGLYYYGARYYAAWTCRFVSVDPLAGEYPFYTPYQYAGNKPIIAIDLDGLEEKIVVHKPERENGSNSTVYDRAEMESGDWLKIRAHYISEAKRIGATEVCNVLEGYSQYMDKLGKLDVYENNKGEVINMSLSDFSFDPQKIYHAIPRRTIEDIARFDKSLEGSHDPANTGELWGDAVGFSIELSPKASAGPISGKGHFGFTTLLMTNGKERGKLFQYVYGGGSVNITNYNTSIASFGESFDITVSFFVAKYNDYKSATASSFEGATFTTGGEVSGHFGIGGSLGASYFESLDGKWSGYQFSTGIGLGNDLGFSITPGNLTYSKRIPSTVELIKLLLNEK